VFRQFAGGRESLQAHVARVHLLLGVLQQVTLHQIGPRELLPADLARELRRQVVLGVLVVVLLVTEPLQARLADDRTLPGVRPRVHPEFPQPEKPALARAAGEVRHPRVDDHVRPEEPEAGELAAAELAAERTEPAVPVAVEVRDAQEPFLADVARVRPLLGVAVHVDPEAVVAPELAVADLALEVVPRARAIVRGQLRPRPE